MVDDEDLVRELLAERFGADPPWHELWAKPGQFRWYDDELTLARRRRHLNEAMQAPADGTGFGRRAMA
jgi:hypothetical protein